MRILLVDNYDSFTYNLKHYVESFSSEIICDVVLNDTLNTTLPKKYDKIIFSPGPGLPQETGSMMDILRTHIGRIPILGICLGHQALGLHFGFHLQLLDEPAHGVATNIHTETTSFLFKGIPPVFKAGRYHSWIIHSDFLPEEIHITARDNKGNIMAIESERFKAYGIQFHPESILTEFGKEIIFNFLKI